MLTRMKSLAAPVIVGALIVCRVAIPISVDGDWIGSLTKCACGDRWIMRFQDHQVRWYPHSDEPGSTPQDFGTCVKTGRSSYRWNFRGKPMTVTAGWLVARIDGMPGNGPLYCWRYPLFWKADRVVRVMEANEKLATVNTATKGRN